MIKKIFIAGHKGMVGSSIYKKFSKSKKYEIIIADKKKLNLINQNDTFNFLKKK